MNFFSEEIFCYYVHLFWVGSDDYVWLQSFDF